MAERERRVLMERGGGRARLGAGVRTRVFTERVGRERSRAWMESARGPSVF